MTESAVRIVLVYPELLGTYGDNGNARVLEQRLRWRGRPVEVVAVRPGEPLPTDGDVYLLGGGEDDPQRHVAGALAEGNRLARAVDRGAAVLAVCAGLQVLGVTFTIGDGAVVPGLGLLDCHTGRPPPGVRRAVGESVVRPRSELGLPLLVGFENHGGRTTLGPAAARLGDVLSGIGNGTPDRAEGALAGRVVGTYLHGPVLALNPAFADFVLALVTGPLEPLDDSGAERARAVRLALAGVDSAVR